jgi:hypothetical protein
MIIDKDMHEKVVPQTPGQSDPWGRPCRFCCN